MGQKKEHKHKKTGSELMPPKTDRRFGIQRKIILTTGSIMIILAIVLSLVMVGALKLLTNTVLLDTLKPMAKIASQAVESNLHILSDRILNAADNNTLRDPDSSPQDRKAVLMRMESGIEFVWIGLYDAKGSYLDGVNDCPKSMAGEEMFSLMESTQNLVINDTQQGKDGLELAIGTPIFGDDGKFLYYLAGSYKYDVINDVLSNINVGATGQAIVINDRGEVMAAQDKKLITDQTLLQDFLPGGEDAESLTNKMIGGEIGSMDIGSGEDKMILSYAPVRGTHWSIAVYAYETDFTDILKRSQLIVFLLVFVMVILAAVIASRFAKTISKPLNQVTNRIDALARGDLSTDIQVVHTRDETETLSIALQKTVHSINQYITELGTVLQALSKGNLNVGTTAEFQGDFIAMKLSLEHISDSLNEIMGEIQSSAKLLQETSQQVSDNARMVTQSSAEQAQCVTQLSDNATQIADSLAEVTDNTRQARELMDETEHRLTSGNDLMHQLLTSMGQIQKNFDHITKINKFLEDIAFQTNILALNAAVEAARAGEAGKGFSVVADEVRALAAKTTESAKSASEIVAASSAAVGEGSSLAKDTADSMIEISEISRNVLNITLKLSDSVEEQKLSLEKMTEEVQSISHLATQNTEVSKQNSDVSSQLTSQAENLNALASKFQLKSKGGFEQ